MPNMPGTNLYASVSSLIEVNLTNNAGNATSIRCAAANLPTGAGYAIGCIAEAADTGVLYYNTGTVTAATFTAVNAGSAALSLPTALTDSTTTTGTSFSDTAASLTTGIGWDLILAGLTTGTGYHVITSTANQTTGAALFGNSNYWCLHR